MKTVFTLTLFTFFCTCLSAQSDCATSIGAGSTTMGTFDVHACAIMQDGTVWCWGKNNYGQLGNGTTTDSDIPVQVSGITNAVKVAAGLFHTTVLLANGTVKSWGRNNFGQLGDGTTTDSPVPVTVPNISNAVAIVAGDNYTSVLLSDNTVWGWGTNAQGQLGNGTNNTTNTVPVQASGIFTAVKITARFRSTCVILADSTIRCWGENVQGHLANGTYLDLNLPDTLNGINNAIDIDLGDHHSLVLLSDGSIRACGLNVFGQLGNGNNTNSGVPVTVSGITNAITVTGGDLHSCALLSNGTIKCWGLNGAGQLGNGLNGQSTVPVSMLNISNPIEVVCGGLSTYVLFADGTVKSCGEDSTGALGNGPPHVDSNTPVQVSSILCTNPTAINELIDGNPSRLDIYPNPGNGIFTIASGTIMESITIFSVMGEKVYEHNVNQSSINIDLSGYTRGIYITTVKYSNGFIQNVRLLLLN